jgi:hypothetical protein
MALGRIDPELLRQLAEAAISGKSLTAVVTLARTPGTAPDPAVAEEQTRRAVDRTVQATGESPGDVHVMGRLSVAYVSGSEKFLREFVGQPEVVAAVANQTSTAGTAMPSPRAASGRSNGGTAPLPH